MTFLNSSPLEGTSFAENIPYSHSFIPYVTNVTDYGKTLAYLCTDQYKSRIWALKSSDICWQS